ncbi:MAG: helix-turn-helix domain-containing protein [Oscillospiraceae bacterium]|nr:helix-turn-helix domain-containing protein [Oscillospiraceae bacterium]
MKESVYKTYDDLPLFLNADMVANVLGISAASSYELMHEKDFPVLKIGNRMVVPKELQAAIDGRLGMFEDRMAKLLYKLTVEMDMGMSATLDCIQIDADYLRRLRANSVRNVKATNGLLTFEQKARAYDDYAEGDDQWHG